MKSLNLKRGHGLWFTPVAAISVLWAIASFDSSPADRICGSHERAEFNLGPDCRNSLGDSRRMPVELEQSVAKKSMADQSQSLAASAPKSGARSYSEKSIQMLNDMIPVPDTDPVLLREIERLSMQQRRFERRYGPESVAARSVRLRLHDLHDHVSTGLLYAVEDKREVEDDR